MRRSTTRGRGFIAPKSRALFVVATCFVCIGSRHGAGLEAFNKIAIPTCRSFFGELKTIGDLCRMLAPTRSAQ